MIPTKYVNIVTVSDWRYVIVIDSRGLKDSCVLFSKQNRPSRMLTFNLYLNPPNYRIIGLRAKGGGAALRVEQSYYFSGKRYFFGQKPAAKNGQIYIFFCN